MAASERRKFLIYDEKPAQPRLYKRSFTSIKPGTFNAFLKRLASKSHVIDIAVIAPTMKNIKIIYMLIILTHDD